MKTLREFIKRVTDNMRRARKETELPGSDLPNQTTPAETTFSGGDIRERKISATSSASPWGVKPEGLNTDYNSKKVQENIIAYFAANPLTIYRNYKLLEGTPPSRFTTAKNGDIHDLGTVDILSIKPGSNGHMEIKAKGFSNRTYSFELDADDFEKAVQYRKAKNSIGEHRGEEAINRLKSDINDKYIQVKNLLTNNYATLDHEGRNKFINFCIDHPNLVENILGGQQVHDLERLTSSLQRYRDQLDKPNLEAQDEAKMIRLSEISSIATQMIEIKKQEQKTSLQDPDTVFNHASNQAYAVQANNVVKLTGITIPKGIHKVLIDRKEGKYFIREADAYGLTDFLDKTKAQWSKEVSFSQLQALAKPQIEKNSASGYIAKLQDQIRRLASSEMSEIKTAKDEPTTPRRRM